MSERTDYPRRSRRFSFTRQQRTQDPESHSESSLAAIVSPTNTTGQPGVQVYSQPRREICVSPTWKKKEKKSKERSQEGNHPDVAEPREAVKVPRRLTKKQPLANVRRASIATSDASRLSTIPLLSSLSARMRDSQVSWSHDRTKKELRLWGTAASVQPTDGPTPEVVLPIPRLINYLPQRFGETISRDLVSGQGHVLSNNSYSDKALCEGQRHVKQGEIPVFFDRGAEKYIYPKNGLQLYRTPPDNTSDTRPVATSRPVMDRSRTEAIHNITDIDNPSGSVSSRIKKADHISLVSRQPQIRAEMVDANRSLKPRNCSQYSHQIQSHTRTEQLGAGHKLRHTSNGPIRQDILTVQKQHTPVMSSQTNSVVPASVQPRNQQDSRSSISSITSCYTARSGYYSNAPENKSPSPNYLAQNTSELPSTLLPASISNAPGCAHPLQIDREHQTLNVVTPFESQNCPSDSQGTHTSFINDTGQMSNDPQPLAKIFVICCSCKFWHDIPSELYARLAVPETFLPTTRLESSNLDSRGQSMVGNIHQNRRYSSPSAGLPTGSSLVDSMHSTSVFHQAELRCCWCNHSMSTACCSGWTTVVHMIERHH